MKQLSHICVCTCGPPNTAITSCWIIRPVYRMNTHTQLALSHTHKHTDILQSQLETLHCHAASVNLITTTPLTILPPWPNHCYCICSPLTVRHCKADKYSELQSARFHCPTTCCFKGQDQSKSYEGNKIILWANYPLDLLFCSVFTKQFKMKTHKSILQELT